MWIFGSRAKGKPKKFSDLDIVIDASQPMPLSLLAALNHDFDESNLPFKVDVVDWNNINELFQKLIAKERVRFLL